MTVGQRIREMRKKRGKTLKDIADATGLSLTFLSDVERDRTQPSLKTLHRLAEVFEVTTTDLMVGVDNLGNATDEGLPAGLRELKEDPRWDGELTEQWMKTLLQVDYQGHRPVLKRDWETLFVTLRNIMDPNDLG